MRSPKILTILLCLVVSFQIFGQDKNVVFIVCDDLVYFDFQSPDCPVIAPNLKMLSDSGVVFTNAHSNSPICSPSRASFLHGKYSHNTGYFGYKQLQNRWFDHENLSVDSSIFAYFHSNGYETVSFGKVFHNGHDSLFENSLSERNRIGDHGPYVNSNGTNTAYPNLPDVNNPVYQSFGPIIEFDPIDSLTWRLGQEEFIVQSDSTISKLTDEEIVENTQNFLDSTNGPFFLSIGFLRPHGPFYAPQEFFDLYNSQEINIPEYLDVHVINQAIASFKNSFGSNGDIMYKDFEDASVDSLDNQYWLKEYVNAYYASVSFVDHQIGQVLEAIESNGLSENTIFLLTSDNGMNLGNHRQIGNKNGLRSASSHVPFIMKGVDLGSNITISNPVSLIDVFPTFCHYTLDSIPLDLDGHSILPLIDESFGEWTGNDFALTEISCQEEAEFSVARNKDHQHYSVVSEDFRYTLYSNGEEEFYDLTVDPLEKFNLANNSDFSAVKSEMKSDLIALVDHDPLEYDSLEHLMHGQFLQSLNGWFFRNLNSSNSKSIIFDSEKGKVLNIINSNGSNSSLENRSIFLEQGKSYELMFSAKCNNASLPANYILTYQGINQERDTILLTGIEVNNTWQDYSEIFTYNQESSKSLIALKIFTNAIGTYDFANFSIKEYIDELDPCQASNFNSAPEGLGIILNNETIKFNWDSIHGATKCQLQGNVITAPINSNVSIFIPGGNAFANSSPTSTFAFPLNTVLSTGAIIEYEKDYRWRVRCGCSANPLIVSPWSAWQSFYLFPPQMGLLDQDAKQLSRGDIYPNPNNGDELHIIGSGLNTARIFSLEMKNMANFSLNPKDLKHQISISLPAGTYIIKLLSDTEILTHKLVIQ